MKNYNPFTMWGSYAGAYILTLIGGMPFLVCKFSYDARCVDELIEKILIAPFINFNSYLGFFLYILLGFLIGWGIHSLFRRLK